MSRTVSLLNRFEDPESSSDPQIRGLVRSLAELDYAPAPRPEFRSELRAQLVAIAARVVTEGDPNAAPAHGPATVDPVAPAAGTARVAELRPPAARKRRSVGRPLGIAAACCAVLALGLGGAVWKSRSALPGDSLYGLKRTSEDVQLSLTHGDTARGHEYLRLATTRVQEARDLLGTTSAMAYGGGVQAGGLSPSTVALIQSTLHSANSDVTSGSSLLGTAAVQSHSASPLTIMTDWAPSQLQQLSRLATALGTGPAHTSTLASWTLVNSALHRARLLGPQVGSHCAAAPSDKLGPVGCRASAPHSSPTSVSPTHHARSSSRTGASRTRHANRSTGTPTGSAAPAGTRAHGSATRSAGSGTSTGPAADVPTSLPTTLPVTLPATLPSKHPVSVGSCGISAQVGPIGVQVRSCPSGS